jgi:hypothetical protein
VRWYAYSVAAEQAALSFQGGRRSENTLLDIVFGTTNFTGLWLCGHLLAQFPLFPPLLTRFWKVPRMDCADTTDIAVAGRVVVPKILKL